MGLRERIIEKTEDTSVDYKVHEILFLEGYAATFSSSGKPDRLVIICQGAEKESRMIEVPYDIVNINYVEGSSPTLTIKKVKQCFKGIWKKIYLDSREWTVSASLQIPPGYEVLKQKPKSQI